MTLAGGAFLLLDLIPHLTGRDGLLPFDPAWVTVCISGLPLLYLALWRIVHNPGVSKISSALLISIAMFAAIAIGDLFAAGEVAFIMAIGAILEEATTKRARKGLKTLLGLAPTQGRRVRGGSEELIPAEEIRRGDLLRILPGETIPVDGTIESGETSVDQSVMTGESLPVDKGVGDAVFCGTINRFGAVDIRATKVGEDSSLQRLIRMVREAEQRQAPMQRIADRWASWLVPVALLIAAGAYLFTRNAVTAVTILVVFCPCALVLATPTAIMAAIGQATKHGVVIKSGEALEKMGRVDAIAFDKTGTLTDGLLSVVKLNPFGEVSPAELLKVAASAEQYSNHPTAVALQKLAAEASMELDTADDFHETPGKGVSGIINGARCLIGRANWMEDQGVSLPPHDAAESEGMSVVYVARDNVVLGWIGLKDKLRREAPAMISDLRRLGVRFCAMVTGDRRSVAETVAAQLQIDEFKSECLPEGKVEFVENIKRNSRVAVVGDGVNDAPALAAGDLGIAMGAIGSDIAVNSASIALMTNDLRRIPMLVFLSRKSRMIINQNLFFGMLMVFGGMVLSVFGWMTPIWAAVLHAGSTLIIIFNSARLVRTGEELTLEEEGASSETGF